MTITVVNNQDSSFYPHFPLNMTVNITAPDKVYGRQGTETKTAIPVHTVAYLQSQTPDYSTMAIGDYWINTYTSPYSKFVKDSATTTVNEGQFGGAWDSTAAGYTVYRSVYRWNGQLYGWWSQYSGAPGWNPIYPYCYVKLFDSENNLVWASSLLDLRSTGSASVTCTYSPSGAIYNGKYRFGVQYIDYMANRICCNSSSTEFDMEYSEWFEAYGLQTSTYAQQSISVTAPTYIVTNEDTATFEWDATPTGTYTSAPLLKLDEKNQDWGVVWKLNYNGSIITVDAAVSLGLVKVISQKSEYLHYLITLKFISANTNWGAYVYYHYTTSSDDSAYYSAAFNTYHRPSPQLTLDTRISKSYPAKWKVGDAQTVANMPNGKPPYFLTFYESTSYTGVVPVKKWVVNYGDSASGAVNTIEYTNPVGQQSPRPEDFVHTFDGYGDYYVSLTLTDMTDTETKFTYTFSPAKTHRWVSANPAVSGGTVVPALLSCTSEVAGYPEPVVTWQYSLSGGTYSATKTGEVAEFSLAESGIYTITCTSVQTGAVNLTQSVSRTITANTANTKTTNAPIPQSDFIAWLYNGTSRFVPIPVDTPTIRWVWNAGKSFSFRVPLTWDYVSMLRVGCLVSCGYNNVARPFVVYSRTNNRQSGFAEIQCFDYAQTLFESRVATVATNSTSDNGYDIQTNYGESMMRYFAISNLGTGRSDSIFKLTGSDSRAGGTQTYSARYESISSIISDLANNSQLGWDVDLQYDANSQDVNYLVGWKPVSGADRSSTVIFSEPFATAVLGTFTETASPSVALGAGKGEGAIRTYTAYDAAGSTPSSTGIARREIFVDAGDAADSDEVKRMSVLELEKGKMLTFYLSIPQNCAYMFGTDYKVGDFVSVFDATLSPNPIKVRIMQATYANTEKGVILDLTCGTCQNSAWSLIQNNMEKNTYARK